MDVLLSVIFQRWIAGDWPELIGWLYDPGPFIELEPDAQPIRDEEEDGDHGWAAWANRQPPDRPFMPEGITTLEQMSAYYARRPIDREPDLDDVVGLDEWLASGQRLPDEVWAWELSEAGLAKANYETALALQAPRSVTRRCAATLVALLSPGFWLGPNECPIVEKAVGELPAKDHAARYGACMYVAVLSEKRGDKEGAQRNYERAVKEAARLEPARKTRDRPRWAEAILGLARLRMDAGDWAAAGEDLSKAVLAVPSVTDPKPQWGYQLRDDLLYSLSLARGRCGQAGKALQAMRARAQYCRDWAKAEPDATPHAVEADVLLAELEAAEGNREEAREALRRAERLVRLRKSKRGMVGLLRGVVAIAEQRIALEEARAARALMKAVDVEVTDRLSEFSSLDRPMVASFRLSWARIRAQTDPRHGPYRSQIEQEVLAQVGPGAAADAAHPEAWAAARLLHTQWMESGRADHGTPDPELDALPPPHRTLLAILRADVRLLRGLVAEAEARDASRRTLMRQKDTDPGDIFTRRITNKREFVEGVQQIQAVAMRLCNGAGKAGPDGLFVPWADATPPGPLAHLVDRVQPYPVWHVLEPADSDDLPAAVQRPPAQCNEGAGPMAPRCLYLVMQTRTTSEFDRWLWEALMEIVKCARGDGPPLRRCEMPREHPGSRLRRPQGRTAMKVPCGRFYLGEAGTCGGPGCEKALTEQRSGRRAKQMRRRKGGRTKVKEPDA